MIVEKILDVILFIPLSLISTILPFTVELQIPDSVSSGLSGLLGGVGYIMPVMAVMPIFVAKTGLKIARLGWALVIRIKSFIPTMGA